MPISKTILKPRIVFSKSRKFQFKLLSLPLALSCFRSFSPITLSQIATFGTPTRTDLIPTAEGLNIAVITGSTRTSGPPTVLGPRVNTYIQTLLERRGHSVTRIDPVSDTSDSCDSCDSGSEKGYNLPLLQKPHFAYPPNRAPSQLQDIFEILKHADGYVCVTPEYNHSPSPGLLNVLNHFGSSVFSFKPSAIVTYSAGQWGGTRAAVALRTTLSELGCLPVSAMIHIPKAHEVFHPDGTVKTIDGGEKSNDKSDSESDEAEKWEKYCTRCFSQLEWWAEAARRHRDVVDPFEESPVFVSSPSQRNAP